MKRRAEPAKTDLRARKKQNGTNTCKYKNKARRVEKETLTKRTLITDLSAMEGTIALISGREHQSKYAI